jgi:2-polyprenyl-6-methoxyphenol hydroxylase-like FAD-dependent oxidoreductase
VGSRTALIVGAGIGGLSAGIALRKAGWQVRIFERAASPRELGFGLVLAPSAVRALGELGVADVVLARAFAPPQMLGEVRRMDGTALKRVDFPVAPVLGGTLTVALRPALHGALLEAIGPDAIAVEREALGFTQSAGRVALRFRSGEPVEGDLLIGADGFGSVIRRALHPSEKPPRPSRVVAVRGAVHGAVHHLHGAVGVYYLGPGIESAIARASDTGIYWFMSLAEELVPRGMTDPAALLAHMAPRFDDTFRAVTSATEELRLDELFDRDPLPFWSQGAVTLLGDAAHPLLPHTGQGAAQAIVDGVTLGRLLTGDVSVADALRRYETERRPKTTALLHQGRRTARVMRMMNPVGCAVRDAAIRMLPAGTIARLIAHINRRAGTDVRTPHVN